jgi:hypothetical protein
VLRPRRKKGRGSCLDLLEVVGIAVHLPSTAWCIPHPLDSCVDLHSSSIGAIVYNTNIGSSSRNSSKSSPTEHLLHHCRRLQSGHHSRLPPTVSRASIAGRWGTSPVSAVSPSKAIHRELWHPRSTSRGANRGAQHHGLAAPTTLSWMRFLREKKF